MEPDEIYDAFDYHYCFNPGAPDNDPTADELYACLDSVELQSMGIKP